MARIPVIATQMMETMITSLTPTRASKRRSELCNGWRWCSNAFRRNCYRELSCTSDWNDRLLKLSKTPLIQVPQNTPQIKTKRFITKTICRHAAIMSDAIKAKAICTLTNSGYTAFQISAWRPSAHILVFTSNKRILTTKFVMGSKIILLW
jgi:pyruvate kinase